MRLLITIALLSVTLLTPYIALAGCQTYTIWQGGRAVTCIQCCPPMGGPCTINCY